MGHHEVNCDPLFSTMAMTIQAFTKRKNTNTMMMMSGFKQITTSHKTHKKNKQHPHNNG